MLNLKRAIRVNARNDCAQCCRRMDRRRRRWVVISRSPGYSVTINFCTNRCVAQWWGVAFGKENFNKPDKMHGGTNA